MLHVTKEAKHMFQRDDFDRPQQLKLDNNTNFIKSKNSLFQDSRYCTVFNKLINIEWIIEITQRILISLYNGNVRFYRL